MNVDSVIITTTSPGHLTGILLKYLVLADEEAEEWLYCYAMNRIRLTLG